LKENAVRYLEQENEEMSNDFVERDTLDTLTGLITYVLGHMPLSHKNTIQKHTSTYNENCQSQRQRAGASKNGEKKYKFKQNQTSNLQNI